MNALSPLVAPLVAAIEVDLNAVVNALIYSLLGCVLFAGFWFVVVKVSPFSIRKEIEEDQNTSLGIILGSVIIGISLIIAAAVGG